MECSVPAPRVPEDRAGVDQAMRDATARGGDWDLECRILRADGEARTSGPARARSATGRAGVRMLGIVGDRTREAAAVQALQDADRRKDEFLATLAHELRNPLAPMRNALEHPAAGARRRRRVREGARA